LKSMIRISYILGIASLVITMVLSVLGITLSVIAIIISFISLIVNKNKKAIFALSFNIVIFSLIVSVLYFVIGSYPLLV